jgi:hypothetical protein
MFVSKINEHEGNILKNVSGKNVFFIRVHVSVYAFSIFF